MIEHLDVFAKIVTRIEGLRLERWERIRNAGILKFTIIRGGRYRIC